jgi:hypothetical protein
LDVDLEVDGPRSLAVHEAAHAVVGARCGLEIDFLKLEYGWWSGDLQSGFVRTRSEWNEERSMDHAACYAAGAVAQEKYLLERGADPGLASRIAEFSGSLDNDDLVDMVKEFGVSVSSARARAEVLIEANWEQIKELGALLEQRGRVSGSKAS